MTTPDPIFVGFLPKITQTRPEWLQVEAIREICSVSECISKGPANRIQVWKHNALGFYGLEQDARAILVEDSEHYDWYAYELFPFHAQDRQIQNEAIPLHIGRVPSDYEFLGFDIVTRSTSAFFECSPLSCNRAAQDFPTNPHCLIESEQPALQALLAMSAPGSGVEPGPYYLFKVYRKKRA